MIVAIDIRLEQMNKKYWVVVYFSNGTRWMPKIKDIGKITSGIGKCEDRKYPNGKGWRYFKEFLDDCFGKTKKEIENLYYERFDPNGISSLNEIANEAWKLSEGRT